MHTITHPRAIGHTDSKDSNQQLSSLQSTTPPPEQQQLWMHVWCVLPDNRRMVKLEKHGDVLADLLKQVEVNMDKN